MVLGNDSSVLIFLVPSRIKDKIAKKNNKVFCLSSTFTVHRFKIFDVVLPYIFLLCSLKKRLHNINDKQAV